MTDLRQAAQQALVALEGWDNYGAWVWPESALEQSKQNTTDSIAALRKALEQPEQQAEPTQWRDMVVVTLVREGINKHKARELADHFAAQPEPPPEWVLIKNILDEYGLQAISFVAEWKAAQQQAEPFAWAVQGITQMLRGEFAELDAKSKARRIGGTCVAYPLYTTPPAAQPEQSYVDGIQDAITLLQDCRENSIDWLIDRLSDYKCAAERTIPAAQRPWVGLTNKEIAEILCDDRWQMRPELMLLACQAKLKEKNT
jgi:hypothetical protein